MRRITISGRHFTNTHLSLFLFFDVDLSPEKFVYYLLIKIPFVLCIKTLKQWSENIIH